MKREDVMQKFNQSLYVKLFCLPIEEVMAAGFDTVSHVARATAEFRTVCYASPSENLEAHFVSLCRFVLVNVNEKNWIHIQRSVPAAPRLRMARQMAETHGGHFTELAALWCDGKPTLPGGERLEIVIQPGTRWTSFILKNPKQFHPALVLAVKELMDGLQ